MKILKIIIGFGSVFYPFLPVFTQEIMELTSSRSFIHCPNQVVQTSGLFPISDSNWVLDSALRDNSYFMGGVGVLSYADYYDSYFVLKDNGEVFVTGENTYFQLGLGDSLPINDWTRHPHLNNIKKVHGSLRDMFAVNDSGDFYVWGTGYDGGLKGSKAFNEKDKISVPTPLTFGYGVADFAFYGDFSNDHILVALNSGQLMAWGRNNYFEMGDTANGYYETPFIISGISSAAKVYTAFQRTLVITQEMDLLAFGSNLLGECGKDPNQYSAVTSKDAEVGLNFKVKDVALSVYSNYVLSESGRVYFFGTGYNGNGDYAESYSPVEVTGLTGIKAISASRGNVIALDSNGVFWGWGENNGVLGNDSMDPVLFATPLDFCKFQTEVEEFETKRQFNLYPNPAYGSIVRSSEKADYEIMQLFGTKVKSYKGVVEMDISDLPGGIYIVKSSTGTIRKLVVR